MTMNLVLGYPSNQNMGTPSMQQWLLNLDYHGEKDINRDETIGKCLLHNPCESRNQMILELLDTMSIHWSAYKCEVVVRVLAACFNASRDNGLYNELAKRIRNGQARRSIHDLFQLPLWLHVMDIWDKKMMEG